MSYIDANAKGRERLRTLVSELTDEELTLQAGDGWTIAALPTLSSYLPHSLAARVLASPTRPWLGWSERGEAVALFADLAGFTPLAEALGELGAQGTEDLTRVLNGVFAPLVEKVHRWGGVVGKFAGDALTALFPAPDGLAHALAGALAMRQHMAACRLVSTLAGDFSIQMKFGLAAGAVLQVVVGTSRRAEFVLAGPAIVDAAHAQEYAAPGEIVLHPSLRARLPAGLADLRPIADNHVLLLELRADVPPAPLPPLPATPDEAAAIEALRPFIPRPVFESILAGGEAFVNEHRRATMLFVSFDGIDYLSEDAPQQLDRYVVEATEAINRFGGYLHRVDVTDKGSGLLILFGAPVAHEDDEKRALLCALALQEIPPRLGFITGQRIGINSGRVFAGNVGSPQRQEYTVIGDAVNLAARLMQAAEPGQTWVAQAALQPVADAFVWQARPPLRVKGKAAPVSAAVLLGPARARPVRLQEPRYALPMVGRREELAHLEALLRQVQESGRGQTVGLTAEAGMGKSRLVAEVIGRALALGFTGYGGHGVSHGSTTSYLAWRPLLRGLLGLAEGQPGEQQVAIAARELAAIHPDLALRLPLLAEPLGLTIPDNDVTAALDGEVRRQSLFALVTDLIRHRAAAGPLLLVLEDAHWLDELSRDLARDVARAIGDRPLFFLTVYRPPEIEDRPALWTTAPPRFTEVRLGPFSAQETGELVRLKLGGRDLPSALVEQVQQRAQGNPFFVDEFVNLIQAGEVDLDDPAALAAVKVPDSLQTLIVSRLDQLAENERIAIRVASVIGRLFRARWLLALYPTPIREELLRRDLEGLTARELVQMDRPDPELEYLFKHALTQEVAYETLSFANRRALHERVAAHIEETYADDLSDWYAILAYHYRRAEHPEKEFTYTRLAADRAAAQFAVRQAAEFYSRALELATRHGLAGPEVRFELHDRRFVQHHTLGEHDRLREDAEAMLALAEPMDIARQVLALTRLGVAHRLGGRPSDAAPCFERAIALGRQSGDFLTLAPALIERQVTDFAAGDYEQGKKSLLETIAASQQAGGEARLYEARACQILGWIVYDEGDMEQTERYWQHALELFQALGRKVQEALVISNLGALYATLYDLDRALAYIEQGLALARQIGYRVGEEEGWIRMAELYMGIGQYERAIEHFERSTELSDRSGFEWGMCYARACMADALLEMEGDLEQAEVLSRQALELGRPILGKEPLGWLLLTWGRVRARRGDRAGAQEAIEESARLRRELKQFYSLLYNLSALAEMHLEQGDLAAARACVEEMSGILFPPDGRTVETEEVAAACLAGYHVLCAMGEEEQAREWLRHGHAMVQTYAGRIRNEEFRRSLLERVPAHREIIAAYAGIA